MTPLLEISKVTMQFGGVRALDSLDMAVHPREIVALIGPNGAGKTTLFNCITGLIRPTRGTIRLNPQGAPSIALTGLKPNQITARGVARTFQNIRLFPQMTVLENVLIGRHCRLKAGILEAILRNPRTRREEDQAFADSYRLLQRFQLEQFAGQMAGHLPYGAQRRLEIARALATEPAVLLLDEPAAGMNARETRALVELIAGLREHHSLTILLIEHDMRLVMSLSDRICVVDYGRKIAEGAPEQVSRDPAVIKAYLGEDLEI